MISIKVVYEYNPRAGGDLIPEVFHIRVLVGILRDPTRPYHRGFYDTLRDLLLHGY